MSDCPAIQDAILNGWKSERLVYRALQDDEADGKFVHNLIVNDPAVFPLAYCEAFRPQSSSMSAAVLATLRNKCLSVVIGLPSDGEEQAQCASGTDLSQPRIGKNEAGAGSTAVSIGVLTLTAPEPELQQHRRTMLGITVIRAHQGKGYGPEAINWALDWAFRFGGMHRVGLTCYAFNDRARRLYEQMGFVQEGRSRECIWFNRAWHDEILYGMLESEWDKLRSLPVDN